ncbi:hypothetical protein [Alteromonas sp. AMM-1]|uniref:hypothetical protein n=1 Tax=Alteromonas sp. AMM-1 TaxID=3394233 RepID=UPI0039A489FD
MRQFIPLFVFTCCATAPWAYAEVEFSGTATIEQRYFLQDPLFPEQRRSQTSVTVMPEVFMDWNDGSDRLTFKPFVRADQYDTERTHADIRELMWLHASESYELRAGIGKVFWGQTESLHLVDVINQTDSVERVDGEEKLGQPMVSASYLMESGAISAYILPYFRERTFAGTEGRLRPIVPISNDNALYESEEEQSNVDYALRWQQSLGNWEVGLSYFDGTNREPQLVVEGSLETSDLVLRPYYEQMQQIGADMLWVNGAVLYKFEAIHRKSNTQSFMAAVAGFEYTTVGIFDSVYDIGWLAEYQYDERDSSFFVPAQNDVMVGLRWSWNDPDSTTVLAGYVQDLDDMETYSAFIEASSRMTDNWKWTLNGYFFSTQSQTDPYFFVRRDDHIEINVEYFF